ncbi:MAG: putative NH(3)-dependent NAD(+) synthetase [Methanosaeta sp. PtaU1.Bin028]|nr:MAG: putative NH(3)-dependent NAD(+) synthetase [Methanosaeta sp. PtaU1.Bin028]
MKIALLQINPTVGDLHGNASLIAEAAGRAADAGADLGVTPEMALLGYPARDLLMDPDLIRRCREEAISLAGRIKGGPPVLVGMAEANLEPEGRPLFNSAVLLNDGAIQQVFRKTLLPTYDVFDEDRYFEPSGQSQVLRLGGLTLGVSICEDIWNDRDFWQRRRYHVDPIESLVREGAEVIINMSASPFTVGKQLHREAMLGSIAQKHGVAVVYVNQVGGNDDLVFDGRSCALSASGSLIARAAAFAEDVAVADLTATTGKIAQDDFSPQSEIWRALVLGTRDYVRKCGFRGVLLGLSGGVDSSVTAAVATEALGPENVLGVLMPSPFSSQGSIVDSLELARSLGIRTMTIPITDIMEAFDQGLNPAFASRPKDVTEENIQARIRGNLLMALSNKFGLILLTTGNKSELSVGYCTIYGDMSGGLAVISDVPKTMVYQIARWLNARSGRPVIPEAILEKAPSAELRFGQTDQDSLPPYPILDEILERHLVGRQTEEEIAKAGFDREMVSRVLGLVKAAEFKRRQAAPGIKVTDRAFGSGWRMPVAWRRG